MYEPLITGNSCVSEDLYSLGEMILCVESSCPCQTCSEEMAKYGEKIIVIIDETGDKKKGRKPDYVKRQYIGNLGKIENGIVAVTAWGLFRGMTFPLIAKVYKPQERLKEGDEYKSKPKIGGEIIQKLKEMGFKIKLVLADSE